MKPYAYLARRRFRLARGKQLGVLRIEKLAIFECVGKSLQIFHR
jgi:hypothetical protein